MPVRAGSRAIISRRGAAKTAHPFARVALRDVFPVFKQPLITGVVIAARISRLLLISSNQQRAVVDPPAAAAAVSDRSLLVSSRVFDSPKNRGELNELLCTALLIVRRDVCFRVECNSRSRSRVIINFRENDVCSILVSRRVALFLSEQCTALQGPSRRRSRATGGSF